MKPVLIILTAVGTIVLGLVVMSWVARRLLGLRIGKLRALLTGGVGLLTAGVVSAAMGPQAGRTPLVSVQLGSALLAAMIFLALSEAMVPSGSLRAILQLPGSLRRRVARGRRYTQLSRIVVRHGLGRFLGGRVRRGTAEAKDQAALARSLRLALEEAGATFVKLGQVLSARYDLLPDVFIDELSSLQHEVTAEPWDEVRLVLMEELGAPPEEVFAEFDQEPLAAGSMAQVHRARLRDGQVVAVKVQRPGARQVVERDLDILFRLGAKLEQHTEWGRTMGAVELVQGFATSLEEELDFRTEARNTLVVAATTAAAAGRDADDDAEHAENDTAESDGDEETEDTQGTEETGEAEQSRTAGFAARFRKGGRKEAAADVKMPTIHQELSSARVLVVEWLDGVTLNRADSAIDERGLDREALARSLLNCLLGQIMSGGVFHADPHPGNILILDDDRIGLLDFGSVGRIDQVLRSSLRNLLLAIDRSDPVALSDALLELVDRPEEIDEERLKRALGRFMARHLTPGTRPDREMFADLFLLVAKYGLTVPPEIAAAFRALATLEGSLDRLVPGFDIITEARSFAADEVTRRLSPPHLARSLAGEALAVLPMLRRLPRRVERITNALEHGRLSVNVRLLADERDRRFVRGIVRDVLLAFLGGMTGVLGVLLLSTEAGPRLSDSMRLYEFLGYNLLLVSSVLVLRVLFTITKPER
ncbi:AarF/UbiB family protein [Streptomyces sp. NPDC006274]|uniref:ABC1 kinase family protein n=1 Tax=unclassified Streptomyces TaxID=2593676 RepID=UPI0033B64FEA